jgi:hypothetical protein
MMTSHAGMDACDRIVGCLTRLAVCDPQGNTPEFNRPGTFESMTTWWPMVRSGLSLVNERLTLR